MRKDIIYKTLKRIQPVMLRAYATTSSLPPPPPPLTQANIIASARFKFVCLFVWEYVRSLVCMCGNHDAFQTLGNV